MALWNIGCKFSYNKFKLTIALLKQKPHPPSSSFYRVTHHVLDLGCWVDFDFVCSSISAILFGLMREWQNRQSSWSR